MKLSKPELNQLFDLSDLEGLTIKKAPVCQIYQSKLSLSFTDGSFIIFIADKDCDGDPEIRIETTPYTLEHDYNDLYYGGIISQVERDVLAKKANDQRSKILKEREYQEYLKLKEKFEGGVNKVNGNCN